MDLDLGQLRALAAAVSEGSLDAAARALQVTPSAISQRIRALEIATGQVLLVRGRPVTVTGPGQTVLRLARQLDLLVAETAAELGAETSDQLPGVPVAVNADSLATWFLPAVAPLADRFCLDVRVADQDVTADLLRAGTVMAAVTSAAAAVPGCQVTSLGAVRYQPVATREFTDRWFADGVTPAALRRAPMVVFDRTDDLQHRYLRRRLRDQATPPTHHVPASADFVTAVQLGFGWGMLPDLQRPDDARLVDLDPAGLVEVPLYWQQWKLRSRVLDALGEAVLASARRALA